MIRTSVKTTLAILILVSIPAAISWAKAEGNAADEAAIKKLVADFSDGFNRHDGQACAMLYAENGEFTSVRGDTNHGRADVEKHYQTVLTTFLKNAHRTDKVRSIRFITPTIASVDTEWQMTGATSANPNETLPSARQGLLTWIVTKQNGRWYISVFHELDYPGK